MVRVGIGVGGIRRVEVVLDLPAVGHAVAVVVHQGDRRHRALQIEGDDLVRREGPVEHAHLVDDSAPALLLVVVGAVRVAHAERGLAVHGEHRVSLHHELAVNPELAARSVAHHRHMVPLAVHVVARRISHPEMRAALVHGEAYAAGGGAGGH